ncbi:hypothetical protein D3C80_2121240 [compost metagenome]
MLGCFQSIHLRHSDVQEDDVGLLLLQMLQPHSSRSIFAGNLQPPVSGQQAFEVLQRRFFIIY